MKIVDESIVVTKKELKILTKYSDCNGYGLHFDGSSLMATDGCVILSIRPVHRGGLERHQCESFGVPSIVAAHVATACRACDEINISRGSADLFHEGRIVASFPFDESVPFPDAINRAIPDMSEFGQGSVSHLTAKYLAMPNEVAKAIDTEWVRMQLAPPLSALRFDIGAEHCGDDTVAVLAVMPRTAPVPVS